MKHTQQHFIEICNSATSMLEASVILNIPFNTFKRYAKKFKCYNTNQSGKGITKLKPYIIPMSEILDGLHPTFQTYKLKNRLIKEGIFINECHVCNLSSQNGKPLKVELHHKDGISTNHKKENLMLICPNCHSQTSNYRGLNKK